MIVLRMAGLFFAFVQITLALRLMLPFVDVPTGLEDYVPALIGVTDVFIAPVLAVVDRFEISGLAQSLAEAGDGTVTGPDAFEPIVLVAMVFWVIVTMFAMFVLRLIFRPGG